MWGASRWTARFLLLAMLVPVVGPLAMPCAALPQAMHYMRQPLSGHPAQPAMHCHHAMAQPFRSEPSEASFQATSNEDCCQHHCCCGAATSEWARPASSLPSFISLATEPARSSPNAVLPSSDIPRQDSARAPPRS